MEPVGEIDPVDIGAQGKLVGDITKEDEMPLLNCVICLENRRNGIRCTAINTHRHFVCNHCFPRYVRSVLENVAKLSDDGFQIRCPVPACPSGPWSSSSVRYSVSRKLFNAYVDLLVFRLQILQTNKSKKEIANRIKQRRTQSIIDALTVSCPECNLALDPNPDGCAAVKCRCGSNLCFLCLKVCQSSASCHKHVLDCPSNPKRDVFTTRIVRMEAQKALKVQAVQHQLILSYGMHWRRERSAMRLLKQTKDILKASYLDAETIAAYPIETAEYHDASNRIALGAKLFCTGAGFGIMLGVYLFTSYIIFSLPKQNCISYDLSATISGPINQLLFWNNMSVVEWAVYLSTGFGISLIIGKVCDKEARKLEHAFLWYPYLLYSHVILYFFSNLLADIAYFVIALYIGIFVLVWKSEVYESVWVVIRQVSYYYMKSVIVGYSQSDGNMIWNKSYLWFSRIALGFGILFIFIGSVITILYMYPEDILYTACDFKFPIYFRNFDCIFDLGMLHDSISFSYRSLGVASVAVILHNKHPTRCNFFAALCGIGWVFFQGPIRLFVICVAYVASQLVFVTTYALASFLVLHYISCRDLSRVYQKINYILDTVTSYTR